MRKLGICLAVLSMISCNEVFTPKPHAYPRIYFPEKNYVLFDTNAPFKFVIPKYSAIQEHSQDEYNKHPFWYDIHYMPFNATLFLSYLTFNNDQEFESLFNDTRKLAYKHDIKAEAINQIEVYNPKNDATGIIYELKGNTATNLNFYISDSKKHFLRGALYFNSKTEIDSIAPMLEFLRKDIEKMIESTEWKDVNSSK
jgi:gliding motility-associated lipoprotein GldD